MVCKHMDTIGISETERKLYCKARSKEISEYDCRDCPLKLGGLDNDLKKMFDMMFGGNVNV